MRFLISFFLFALFANYSISQDLVLPIEGIYGEDYIIVNYPDWHFADGPVLVEDGILRDHLCGSKTYDGHQGTDFVITGFPQMDAGVNVLAIEGGEIIHITEDLFDRETDGIVEFGLGNYIGIYHPSSNTYSYYAHLKMNSVIVEVGDMVVAGETIAQVGSSGNSTDPHLHFELWNPGLLTDPTIDPWGIPCDSGTNLWESSPSYDTSYAVWDCGFVNYDSVENFIPSTWYSLKERLGIKTSFSTDDPFFTFWALQYGLKIGDQTTLEWYEPNGDLYATSTTAYTTQDWWFHYYNNSIPRPPISKQGSWSIRYYYNDSLQLTKSISYGNLGLQETQSEKQSPFYYSNDEQSITVVLPNEIDYSDFSLYSVSCQTITEKQPLYSNKEIVLSLPDGYNSGVYILSLSTSLTTYSMKILFK